MYILGSQAPKQKTKIPVSSAGSTVAIRIPIKKDGETAIFY